MRTCINTKYSHTLEELLGVPNQVKELRHIQRLSINEWAKKFKGLLGCSKRLKTEIAPRIFIELEFYNASQCFSSLVEKFGLACRFCDDIANQYPDFYDVGDFFSTSFWEAGFSLETYNIVPLCHSHSLKLGRIFRKYQERSGVLKLSSIEKTNVKLDFLNRELFSVLKKARGVAISAI